MAIQPHNSNTKSTYANNNKISKKTKSSSTTTIIEDAPSQISFGVNILSCNENCAGKIIKYLNKVENLKHKTILSLAYSTGMRISEVCALRLKDLKFDKSIITVISKHKTGSSFKERERVIQMTDLIKKLLNTYIQEYNPTNFLFSLNKNKQFTPRACEKIYKKYVVIPNTTFNYLRFAFFYNLLQKGIDIKLIKDIMGYASVRSLSRYKKVINVDSVNKKLALPI